MLNPFYTLSNNANINDTPAANKDKYNWLVLLFSPNILNIRLLTAKVTPKQNDANKSDDDHSNLVFNIAVKTATKKDKAPAKKVLNII